MKAPNARNRLEQSVAVASQHYTLGEKGIKWRGEKMSVIALKCFVVEVILPGP